jgi:allantoicase
LLGEHAFAKVMGLKVDKKKYFVGNKRADFVIEEVSIEVKTRQQDLSFVKLSDFIADVAVLVTYDRYDYSQVWIQGWTTRHDFRQLHYIDNFGYGDRPCMQPCDLLSLKWLRHYCLMRSRVT